MRSKYRKRIQRRLIDRKKRPVMSLNVSLEERMKEVKMNMELKDYNSVA